MVSIRHSTQAPTDPTGRLPRSVWDADHTVPIATQAEAEAGSATNKLMTPQRVAQAIAALAGESVTITTFTDEAAFNAATAGPLDLLVLVDA